MNILEAATITSPFGETEECAKFSIYDVTDPFTLHDITRIDKRYTLSFWIKSNIAGSITIQNVNIPVNTAWKREVLTFVASDVDLSILFNTVSTFYIYQSQLEIGNKDSDWKEAPEDTDEDIQNAQQTADDANNKSDDAHDRIDNAESLIKQLNDCIAMLVRDANGTSLMEQTADGGWMFSMAQTQTTIEEIKTLLGDLEVELGDTSAVVERLDKSLTDVESSIEWIEMSTYEDEPCIILGETDSDFRLIITNTRIMFTDGGSIPAYVSNKALHIKKAIIEEELQQGDFVWKQRSSGNMGLIWKGVTN